MLQLCLNEISAGRRPPTDPARHLAAIRAGGWTAIELWMTHWDAPIAERGLSGARRLLDEAGLVATGGCAQGGLFFSRDEALRRSRDELRRRLEQCQALGAPHLVVTPTPPPEPERDALAELERAADLLREAGELARPYGVRLGIEFLKGARIVNNVPTALWLAERVRHPDVGVLVDTFHLYAGLSKVEDLDLFAGKGELISYVHVNDVPAGKPRELWTDLDRVLPGEGALPIGAMLGAIARARYTGVASLEIFNAAYASRWEEDPVAAARAAYEATARTVAAAS